ncbi:MAG: hypothetical protein ACOYM8_16300 [Caulobacterales bacterium]
MEAFGYEDPRRWYRLTDGRYLGLEQSMEILSDFCRRERPDGIAGYSNGAGAALLAAAAREAGDDAFRSIRFVMSFAGPTSPSMQGHIHDIVGKQRAQITIPSLLFGSRRDPMLTHVDQFARDFFTDCEHVVDDEARPFANHALPENESAY